MNEMQESKPNYQLSYVLSIPYECNCSDPKLCSPLLKHSL